MLIPWAPCAWVLNPVLRREYNQAVNRESVRKNGGLKPSRMDRFCQATIKRLPFSEINCCLCWSHNQFYSRTSTQILCTPQGGGESSFFLHVVPRSAGSDVIVISILLPVAGTSGLKQNGCCVKESPVGVTFSFRSLPGMTNSTVEISEVGVQVLGWRVTLHSWV